MSMALPARRPQSKTASVVAAALLLLFFAGLASAQSLREVPPLETRVTDLTGTLSAADKASIDAGLARLESDTGSQVAVLVVDTTAPEAIEQYSLRVAEVWQLGRADIDDGVLFLVALADRRMRIEVGYGLEGALPDARASRIINDIVAPLFRRGDFGAGIAAGADAIATVVRGEELPLPERKATQQGTPDLFSLLPLILIFSVVLGGPLKQALGTLPGALITGGLAGGVGWLIVGIFGSAILIGLVTFFINLLTVAGPGSWSSGGGGYRGGYGGGFGGGGGGFGGGGGGFGGGGGGFGGGGASGGW